MKGVGIKQFTECHLDPDLNYWARTGRMENWKAAFGQAGSSESRLQNEDVGQGDLFLFFGWFRPIIKMNGKYSYIKVARDQHIIYGFLKIEEVFDMNDPTTKIPNYLSQHPHVVQRAEYAHTKNRIYVGQGGTFYFNQSLVLTREGESKQKWQLPSFFGREPFKAKVDLGLLPDGNLSINFTGRTQQELLVSSNPDVIKWAEDIILENRIQIDVE